MNWIYHQSDTHEHRRLIMDLEFLPVTKILISHSSSRDLRGQVSGLIHTVCLHLLITHPADRLWKPD